MRFLRHAPSPALAPWIEYLWCLTDAPAHAAEHILPTGTLELVVNLAEDEFRIYQRSDLAKYARFPGAIVSGAYRRYFVIDTREHAAVLGVHFRPGGALPFLGVPPGALADTHVELEAMWGAGARELREQLCAAGTAERFQILEHALRERLGRSFRAWPAAQVAIEALSRGVRVRDLATQLALSERRLITLFTAHVGMTPKVFARVYRFQRALARAQADGAPDWSELALRTGYYDQSHLSRDFVEFAGFPPGGVRRQRGPMVKASHVAVLDDGRSFSSNTRGTSGLRLSP